MPVTAKQVVRAATKTLAKIKVMRWVQYRRDIERMLTHHKHSFLLYEWGRLLTVKEAIKKANSEENWRLSAKTNARIAWRNMEQRVIQILNMARACPAGSDFWLSRSDFNDICTGWK